jgi:uncharacterized membrane protein YdbT with pleckstrin-like domain
LLNRTGSPSDAMRYVRRVLQPGETVSYATTLHWCIYLRALPPFVVCVAVLIAPAFIPQFPPDFGWVVEAVAALFALLGLLRLLTGFIRRATTEFAVTNRRVIYKFGLIRRVTFEMNLSTVESVHVDQSMLGRLLDFGRVEIRGTGSSFTPDNLISDPLGFRSHITARA